MLTLCLHGTPIQRIKRYDISLKMLDYISMNPDYFFSGDDEVAETDKILITFDDGEKSNLEAARLLAKKQITAIFFVNVSTIGKSGKLSLGDLHEIIELGHIIGDHFFVHEDVRNYDDKDFVDLLEKSRKFFTENRLPAVRHFAFPGGLYEQRHTIILHQMQFYTVHTTSAALSIELLEGAIGKTNIIHRIPFFEFMIILSRWLPFGVWKKALHITIAVKSFLYGARGGVN